MRPSMVASSMSVWLTISCRYARSQSAGVSAGQLPHGAEARGFERERLAPGQHLAQRDHVAE